MLQLYLSDQQFNCQLRWLILETWRYEYTDLTISHNSAVTWYHTPLRRVVLNPRISDRGACYQGGACTRAPRFHTRDHGDELARPYQWTRHPPQYIHSRASNSWHRFVSPQPVPLTSVLNSQVPIDNKSALVQVMAWRGTGDKPLCEPMLTQFADAYMQH